MLDTPARAPRSRRSAVRRWIPPQHGAWAMLLLPFAVGVAVAGTAWVELPLLVAWVAAYPLSYWALLAAKTRRVARYRPQLLAYGGVTAAAGAITLAAQPRLVAFAPAYAALLAVNVVAARLRADRSLVSGLASVASSCLVVPVVAVAAGRPASPAVLPALVLFAYFAGSVLYVKTVIRERGDARWLAASVAVHVVAAVAIGVASWPLGLLFAALAVRAAALPRLGLSPLRTGLVEIVASVALLVAVPLLLG